MYDGKCNVHGLQGNVLIAQLMNDTGRQFIKILTKSITLFQLF